MAAAPENESAAAEGTVSIISKMHRASTVRCCLGKLLKKGTHEAFVRALIKDLVERLRVIRCVSSCDQVRN